MPALSRRPRWLLNVAVIAVLTCASYSQASAASISGEVVSDVPPGDYDVTAYKDYFLRPRVVQVTLGETDIRKLTVSVRSFDRPQIARCNRSNTFSGCEQYSVRLHYSLPKPKQNNTLIAGVLTDTGSGSPLAAFRVTLFRAGEPASIAHAKTDPSRALQYKWSSTGRI